MSEAVVELVGVGKMYKLFTSRRANLVDALGLGRLLPGVAAQHHEFWALRGLNLHMQRRERVGVIGRNGAGKTTLLRLITGNLKPSEGRLTVQGRVQSLIEVGGGLHPEFTGLENIRAALTYQGLSSREIRQAEAEIAEFTELGDFIERPFKTYSLGMQARLAFTIATAINPELLVIDEILGTGDAYFFGKSLARMQELVEGGATAIIVSHALDQIVRFCDRTIWLDRGQIVAQGPTLEVVKAYEKFIRVLEDRRLRGKNQKVRSKRFKGLHSEGYIDNVIVRATVEGPPGAWCDIAEISLLKGDEIEDRLLVGNAQDADTSQSASVVLDSGRWGPPTQDGDRFFRRIQVAPVARGTDAPAHASAKIYCWAFEDDKPYRAEVVSRSSADASLIVEVVRNGELLTSSNVQTRDDWTKGQIGVLAKVQSAASATETEPVSDRNADGLAPLPPAPDQAIAASGVPEIANLSRWPGERTLVIDAVHLVDGTRNEQTVFNVGETMRIIVDVRAQESGVFPLTMASLIFRLDGIVVTRHIGEHVELAMKADETVQAVLDLTPLNLGNAYYVLSVGLYRKLDVNDIEAPQIYDYLDRSFEFQVVGNTRLHNELFRHPGRWSLNQESQAGHAPRTAKL